ncbi:MAG: hypothetical protein FWC94_01235 [Bacteroidales bacterium]|nr:hypothetical protein [Bacteroidales bacterium]
MNKLEERSDGKYTTRKKPFVSLGVFEPSIIERVFEFAYDMTFGKTGEHRNHRTGGTHRRKKGEIFANTFQGKLAEFAFCNTACQELPHIEEPDLSISKLGIWDDSDFVVDNHTLNIKSIAWFSDLLLLETKDWNEKGQYTPNLKKEGKHADYDFFILVKMKPDSKKLLSGNRMLFTNTIDKELLKKMVLAEKWEYDIPGWCCRHQLVEIIKKPHIIREKEMLNGTTPMDADNYYIQAGDMHNIESLINILKDKK